MATYKLEYELLSKPSDKLKCPICLEVARDPKQHEDCGKIFCSECIAKLGNKPCPSCRTENRKYFLDRRGAQEIRDLPVKCGNHVRGCQWEGVIGTVSHHSETCNFAAVICPNKCGTSGGVFLELMRSEISKHLLVCPNREFQCQYCEEKGTYAGITGDHDRVCKRKVITCPNDQCGTRVERGKIREHTSNNCLYAFVPCSYKEVGCNVVRSRKDMVQHEEEDVRSHLGLAMTELASMKSKSMTLRYSESVGFKVSEFSTLKKSDERFYFGTIHSIEGYHVRFGIDANGCGEGMGTHLSVSIELLDGKREKETDDLVEGGILVCLLNQVSDSNHIREMFRIKRAQVGQVLVIPRFISHTDLYSESSDLVQFLVEDTLYFRVGVQSFSYKDWLDCGVKVNTPFIRMLDDFRTLKQDPFTFKVSGYSTGTRFVSDPFLVGPCYSMSVVVLDNEAGSCLDVHCSVRKSRSITSLKWPFSGTIKVELLNQVEDKNHHSKSLQLEGSMPGYENTVAYGSTNFISKSSLNPAGTSKVRYLLDDCLYFRVKISVNGQDRKPWLECKSGCTRICT